MTDDRGRPYSKRLARRIERALSDERTVDWMGEHETRWRRSVYEQQILHWSLAIGFVVGLAAHVGGYVLGSSATTEPLGLVTDLLYALGLALWTGVVVVVFAQVIPEVKRRQITEFLDAYDAAQRDEVRTGSDQASGDDEAPTASWRPGRPACRGGDRRSLIVAVCAEVERVDRVLSHAMRVQCADVPTEAHRASAGTSGRVARRRVGCHRSRSGSQPSMDVRNAAPAAEPSSPQVGR